MRTAIASRTAGNVHVQLESGWLVSCVLDIVKGVRVARSRAIVEETARRAGSRRRRRRVGRVSSDRRRCWYRNCSCTADRTTPCHTDVQRGWSVRSRIAARVVVAVDGTLQLIHRATTLLLLSGYVVRSLMMMLLLLLKDGAKCRRWECARRLSWLLSSTKTSRACLPIVAVLQRIDAPSVNWFPVITLSSTPEGFFIYFVFFLVFN